MKTLSRKQLRVILLEEILKSGDKPSSEMSEFSKSRSGKKVMAAGRKIISAANTIKETADDQTGSMRLGLLKVTEFVAKTGMALEGLSRLDEDGSSAADALPTVQELKQLYKEIKNLEK